jgi:putative aminopeptidase FrvX
MDVMRDIRKKEFIFSAYGVSGREEAVRERIAGHVRPFVDDVLLDVTGSLICVKKGKKRDRKRIFVSAHMDTIGFVITYIDERGFLRFSEVGGQPEAYLLGKRVVFENGTIGVIGTEKAEYLKNLRKDKMFIDIGAKERAEAERLVKIGDTCAVHAPVAQAGGIVTGGWMDDRIGCFVLLEVIEAAKETPHDLFFVFSSQEEVGLRGAKTSAYRVEPDLGLVVDVTESADLPEGDITGSSHMGKGAAVKVMDNSVIVQKSLVDYLCGLAAAHGIPFQRDVLRVGGTDTHEIQLSRSGAIAGGVSIPTRYIHSAGEMCALSDVQACIDLVARFCEDEKNPCLA